MPESKADGIGWERLESLFAKASGMPAEERLAFLDAECAGNAELRRELNDHARSRLAAKRGGNTTPIPFHELEAALESGPFSDGKAHAVLALDESLTRLAQQSERQSRVVECRFFAGLSVEETAAALGISPATVKRDWTMAQAWLYRDLGG